jgi:hypothetical protein
MAECSAPSNYYGYNCVFKGKPFRTDCRIEESIRHFAPRRRCAVLFLESGKCIKQLHERRRGRSLALLDVVISILLYNATLPPLPPSSFSPHYRAAMPPHSRRECVGSFVCSIYALKSSDVFSTCATLASDTHCIIRHVASRVFYCVSF